MFCTSCGVQLAENTNFCTKCGAQQQAAAAPPPPPPQQGGYPPQQYQQAQQYQPPPQQQYQQPAPPPYGAPQPGQGTPVGYQPVGAPIWVIIGYVFAFTGGFIGIGIGGWLFGAKVDDPYGNKVKKFKGSTRTHGMIILAIHDSHLDTTDGRIAPT